MNALQKMKAKADQNRALGKLQANHISFLDSIKDIELKDLTGKQKDYLRQISNR